MSENDHWQENLRIAQAVLDKLEREADPIQASVYRSALNGVESELTEEEA